MPGISWWSEVDHGVAVRLPLDDLAPALREHPREVSDGVERLGEAQPSPELVDEVGVDAAFGPDLADDVVGRLGVPERAVPALGDVEAVEPERAVGALRPEWDVVTPPPLLQPYSSGLRCGARLAQLLSCDLARGFEGIPLGEVTTMAAVS
jgi:hypothetical protein